MESDSESTVVLAARAAIKEHYMNSYKADAFKQATWPMWHSRQVTVGYQFKI